MDIKKLFAFMLICILMVNVMLPVLATAAEDSEEDVVVEPGEEDPGIELPPVEPVEPIVPVECSHVNFANGMAGGLFCPHKALNRAELAQMVYNALYAGETPAGSHFADVSTTAWYYVPINVLAEHGVMSGSPSGNFYPKSMASRASCVNVLYAASGLSAEGVEGTVFNDIPQDHWAYIPVMVAYREGWVNGTGGDLFTPDRSVNRAEAVTMLNRYLGRKPDAESISKALNARFFPDVLPGRWYYNDIMEATIAHVCLCDEQRETWEEFTSYPTEMVPGFHLVNELFFLVNSDRTFVRTAGTGSYNGVFYTCRGMNGVLDILSSMVELANGTTVLVKNGAWFQCTGTTEFNGAMYYAKEDHTILRDGYWNTLYFGKDGKYTSGNASIDKFIDTNVANQTNSSMTQLEKLRACYDYITRNVAYQSNNNHVARGAAASTWTESYMLRLMERGKGNCYSYAAEMYYFARRLGYAARAISGGYMASNSDHGWVEITFDGVPYLFDPELNHTRGLAAGALFKVAYDKAPWKYWRP